MIIEDIFSDEIAEDRSEMKRKTNKMRAIDIQFVFREKGHLDPGQAQKIRGPSFAQSFFNGEHGENAVNSNRRSITSMFLDGANALDFQGGAMLSQQQSYSLK